MKKFLTGEKNRTKKNTTEKMTTPMPMGRKQKKWMSLYMALVLTVTVGATTAFAAGDPLSVINNLSSFIFSLIRAIGLILLGSWLFKDRPTCTTPLAHDDLKIDINRLDDYELLSTEDILGE